LSAGPASGHFEAWQQKVSADVSGTAFSVFFLKLAQLEKVVLIQKNELKHNFYRLFFFKRRFISDVSKYRDFGNL